MPHYVGEIVTLSYETKIIPTADGSGSTTHRTSGELLPVESFHASTNDGRMKWESRFTPTALGAWDFVLVHQGGGMIAFTIFVQRRKT